MNGIRLFRPEEGAADCPAGWTEIGAGLKKFFRGSEKKLRGSEKKLRGSEKIFGGSENFLGPTLFFIRRVGHEWPVPNGRRHEAYVLFMNRKM